MGDLNGEGTMRRISTDRSNRLPDDFVAVVLTEEELNLVRDCVAYCIKEASGDVDLEKQCKKLETNFKKLTEGDKWSES